MKKLIGFVAILVAVAACSFSASAQARTRGRFAANTHEGTVRGTVSGYTYHDYVVGARAGQHIKLKVTGSAQSTVFSLLGASDAAVDGAVEADNYDGVLPDTRDYVVRVMMMRSQARRKGSI